MVMAFVCPCPMDKSLIEVCVQLPMVCALTAQCPVVDAARDRRVPVLPIIAVDCGEQRALAFWPQPPVADTFATSHHTRWRQIGGHRSPTAATTEATVCMSGSKSISFVAKAMLAAAISLPLESGFALSEHFLKEQ